ncbi:MAG TPA: hypothetical protein VGH28_05180 [Polyangiaceae bacterium]|jgi:hypothetical protein
MAIRELLGGLLTMGLLAGCGGSAAYTGGASSVGPSAAPESVGAREASPPPSNATSPMGGGDVQARNEAPERPGLGTGWGETRASRVHEVSFDRDGATPFATGMLHYNDWQGVQALAAYHQSTANVFHDVPEAGGAITVSIVGENGRPLDALKLVDRTFVIGREGERYSIVMTNHTNHRFEALATVDGLDVINGRPAALDNRGYILGPFDRLEVDGFRRSSDAVAAFRFSRTSESYAAQTSGDRNVGVIGVAFFAERGDAFTPWTEGELQKRDTANPFPADLRFAQPPR